VTGSVTRVRAPPPPGDHRCSRPVLHRFSDPEFVTTEHYSKAWGDSCGDCGEKWLQEVAKFTTCVEFEGLKMLQRKHNLQISVFSRRWKRKKCKRAPSRCCPCCSHNACMKFDKIEIRFITISRRIQMLCINSHIKNPSPPKSLHIFLLCPTVDPQLRVDARSGKHNIAPVPTCKHQIRLRASIDMDRVQKYFGEYFYRDKVDFVTERPISSVTGQLVAPFDARPIPIGVRIHGGRWRWVWVGFRD